MSTQSNSMVFVKFLMGTGLAWEPRPKLPQTKWRPISNITRRISGYHQNHHRGLYTHYVYGHRRSIGMRGDGPQGSNQV